jgi:adenylate cyclase
MPRRTERPAPQGGPVVPAGPAGVVPPDAATPDAAWPDKAGPVNGATAPAPTPAMGALLESLNAAVAAADPETLRIRVANARFQEWFATPEGVDPEDLLGRVPGADPERARDRLERGRPYLLETEVRVGPRALSVGVELRRVELEDGPAVVVEGVSITKQKEAEYMLDSYSRMVERQTRALEQEKERVEKLLLNIMPRRVYEELKDFGTTTPQAFESASVLLLDFVGFTEMAISRDPGALIAELNDVFTSFDRIVEHFRCERIKTIGDAYMAVAGVPESDPDHDLNLAHAALRMRRFLEKRNASAANQWACRIGIGRGPVIGSIVGIQKYVYDIFGPAVNMAARLEHMCEPMQILIAADTHERIRDEFVTIPVGEVELRGFGKREVFSLEDVARPAVRGPGEGGAGAARR